MPRDDDQHHAGRQDAHHRTLDRQIVKIARREEDPVGQQGENHPDHQHGADHRQHAGIQTEDAVGLKKQVANAGLARQSIAGSIAHDWQDPLLGIRPAVQNGRRTTGVLRSQFVTS